MKKLSFFIIAMAFLIFNASAMPEDFHIDDGLSHTIDDDTFRDDNVRVDFNVINNPGTHVELVDGGIVSYLQTRHNATATMFGGTVEVSLNAWDNSTITMTGGSVATRFGAWDNARIKMTGGTVMWDIIAFNNSTVTMTGGTVDELTASHNGVVTISGGRVGKELWTFYDGTIYLKGTNFEIDGQPLSYGDKLSDFGTFVEEWDEDILIAEYYTGTIRGRLSDGSVLDNTFYIWNSAPGFLGSADIIVISCDYVISGDLDDDCKVDIVDFAIMAANWLTDCNAEPNDPACVPKVDMALNASDAADAGITRAFIEMKYNLDTALIGSLSVRKDEILLASETNVFLSSSGAKYSYTVGAYVPGQGYTVTSTGVYGNQSRTIKARFDFQSLLFGIGVNNTVDLKIGTTFTKTPVNADFTIHTNSIESNQILLKSGTIVPGDVVIGPNGDPNSVIVASNDAIIEGEAYAAAELLEFPLPVAPVCLPAGVMVPDQDDTTIFTIKGSGIFNSLTIDIGDTLYISADDPDSNPLVEVYILGETRLHNSASIIVTAGTIAHIYLGGDFISDNGSDMYNENLSAATLTIYGLEGCTEIDLKAKSDFYGYIYAPNAEISLFNSGDFFGAITGDSFGMKNSGVFNYVAEIAAPIFVTKNFALAVISCWED